MAVECVLSACYEKRSLTNVPHGLLVRSGSARQSGNLQFGFTQALKINKRSVSASPYSDGTTSWQCSVVHTAHCLLPTRGLQMCGPVCVTLACLGSPGVRDSCIIRHRHVARQEFMESASKVTPVGRRGPALCGV